MSSTTVPFRDDSALTSAPSSPSITVSAEDTTTLGGAREFVPEHAARPLAGPR